MGLCYTWQKFICRCNQGYSSVDLKIGRVAWIIQVDPMSSQEPLRVKNFLQLVEEESRKGSLGDVKDEWDVTCCCWFEDRMKGAT